MDIHGSRVVKAIAGFAAVALLAVTGGCGSSTQAQTPGEDTTEQSGPIAVVASINQWGSLAEQIGGDDVSVTSILSSTNVDAHDFEPQTSDVAKLAKAQVVVANGAGYDSWATKNVAKDAQTVSAAQIVGAMEGDNPHLWFSKDARNGMAQELVNAFSKVLPSKKKAFNERYKAWQKKEKTVEQAMDDFSAAHKDVTYAATEAVAYYLMSDMGFTDKTPKGYAASAAAEGEAAPADLQEFQKLLEDKGVDLLVNNTQEASDATNMITGTAGRADVPVFDVSEQMPKDMTSLTEWIGSLVDTITGYFDVCGSDDTSNQSGDDNGTNSSDGKKTGDDAATDGTSDDDSDDTDTTTSCKAGTSSSTDDDSDDDAEGSGTTDSSSDSSSSSENTSSDDAKQPDPGK
ncbi:metal ABC transporter solute-binding protein, Zn/Mn family [Bifidobacterium ramosum]|nr:zinc ABC transporter substrate-binding protein [Bifidobacterium ramosum]NEG72200.1 ABC transporter substrate-binding protein [Bifidobacterium ramosum]